MRCRCICHKGRLTHIWPAKCECERVAQPTEGGDVMTWEGCALPVVVNVPQPTEGCANEIDGIGGVQLRCELPANHDGPHREGTASWSLLTEGDDE